MSAKTRRQQVCFMLETQAGVAISQASLLTAANAKLLATNVNCSFDTEQYEREIFRSSQSGLNTIAGVVEANLSLSFELSGSTLTPGSGNAIVWDALLRACCVDGVQMKRGTITGALTGTKVFEHGTILKNAGDTVRGRVLGDFWTGQTVLHTNMILGANFGSAAAVTDIGPDGLLAGGGTVTFDAVSQASDAGRAWRPCTDTIVTVDYTGGTGTPFATQGDILVGDTSGAVITPYFPNPAAVPSTTPQALPAGAGADVPFILLDGVISSGENFTNKTATGTLTVVTDIKQTISPTLSIGLVQDGRFILLKGCRGNFSIAQRIGQPAIVTCNFKGSIAATPGSAAGIPNVTYESPVPSKFIEAIVKVGAQVSGEPGFDAYATEHTPRVTGWQMDYGAEVQLERDATSATGTVVAQHVATRKTTFSLDPVVRPEATFPWMKKVQNGEQVRVRIQTGSTLKNTFTLQLPAWKPEGPNSGDEIGFLRDKLTGRCSGTKYDGSSGDEREFCLKYHELDHPTTHVFF